MLWEGLFRADKLGTRRAYAWCMKGWSRREMLEGVVFVDAVLNLSDDERRWDDVVDHWKEGRRLERLVRRLVRTHGLSLGHYQVLEAADRMIRVKADACSQLDIGKRTGLGKSSVSRFTRFLSHRGLVDVRPDAWFLFDRIWVTREGKELLALLQASIANALRQESRPKAA